MSAQYATYNDTDVDAEYEDEYPQAYDEEDDQQEPQADTKQKKKQRKSTAGRKLKRWDPLEDQHALLCVLHVVDRDGVDLSWDRVALVLQPNGSLTGEAVRQHLLKTRDIREAKGFPAPPKLDRSQIKRKNKKDPAASASASASASNKGHPLLTVTAPPPIRKSNIKQESSEDKTQILATRTLPKTSSLLVVKEPKPKKKKATKAATTTMSPAPQSQKRKAKMLDVDADYDDDENKMDVAEVDTPTAKPAKKKSGEKKRGCRKNLPLNSDLPQPYAPAPNFAAPASAFLSSDDTQPSSSFSDPSQGYGQEPGHRAGLREHKEINYSEEAAFGDFRSQSLSPSQKGGLTQQEYDQMAPDAKPMGEVYEDVFTGARQLQRLQQSYQGGVAEMPVNGMDGSAVGGMMDAGMADFTPRALEQAPTFYSGQEAYTLPMPPALLTDQEEAMNMSNDDLLDWARGGDFLFDGDGMFGGNDIGDMQFK